MPDSFHIVTFGCQMNKLDSELIRTSLKKSGMQYADDPSKAGVLLYNTCSVREHAEHKVFSHIGKWRKRAESDPDFILGVTGCMAQRLGKEIIKRFPFVSLVCGTQSFMNIPEYIRKIDETKRPMTITDNGMVEYERDPTPLSASHHAYVSIMRGCSNYCSYCIVPRVRGPEVSRPQKHIVEEVADLAQNGISEVTLLGQNVNAYGRHNGKTKGAEGGLAPLLDAINAIDGIKRIRFVTSHPKDMSEDILSAVAHNSKVCEHLHMPIQSGSDKILKAMNRGYDRSHYLETVEKARRLIPDAAFSSDFIVGFPGETENDFQHTLTLLKSIYFQQSYIFRYSPRSDTRAWHLPDDVPDVVKRQRQQVLLAAQEETDTKRRSGLEGRTLEVMCTGKNSSRPDEGRLMGRTRQNDIVVFDDPTEKRLSPGDVLHVNIRESTALTLFGTARDENTDSTR